MNYSDELVNKAFLFAKEKHNGQFRKFSNIPYVYHPLRVASLLDKYMSENDELNKYKIVGLLHDTLEDTDTKYEELVKLYGEDVANMVLDLTNDKDEKKKLGKTKYLQNKLVNMNDEVLIIKLCDRLDNISTLGDACIGSLFRDKYFKETYNIINYLISNRKLNEIHKSIILDIYDKLLALSKIYEDNNDFNKYFKKIKNYNNLVS